MSYQDQEQTAKIRAAREQHASVLALARQLRVLGCWDTAAAVSEDAAGIQAGIAQLEAATAAGTENQVSGEIRPLTAVVTAEGSTGRSPTRAQCGAQSSRETGEPDE